MDCKICYKTGKKSCMFCGYRPRRKMDMTVMEQIKEATREEEINWLLKTRETLKVLGMASTGSFETDEKIRRTIGDWGDLSRGTITTRDGDKFGVRLDSGVDLEICANYREAEVGQRVTVRYINGEARL